jgi:hypothetical protein
MKRTEIMMGKEKLKLRLRRVDPYWLVVPTLPPYIIARNKLYNGPARPGQAAIDGVLSRVRPGAILDTLY